MTQENQFESNPQHKDVLERQLRALFASGRSLQEPDIWSLFGEWTDAYIEWLENPDRTSIDNITFGLLQTELSIQGGNLEYAKDILADMETAAAMDDKLLLETDETQRQEIQNKILELRAKVDSATSTFEPPREWNPSELKEWTPDEDDDSDKGELI